MAWTLDSRSYHSLQIAGATPTSKQALDQDSAQPAVATSRAESDPPLSTDGSWIVYVSAEKMEDPHNSAQLMRIPMTGGTARGGADNARL